ncbi:MAG: (2Fe-2S)-binding protein [Actinomycetia bacterium]|nr:(2Fe-2S)-binding protein [Actinomycetes bacterium]
MGKAAITLTVNGAEADGLVEPRRTLADFLREDLALTGTKLGCEQGVCGACTVLLDGQAVRSCLLFAVQAQGASVTTVEGLAASEDFDALQKAFSDNHGLQCGYCTPGVLMTTRALLDTLSSPSENEIREALSGNICRCTGYHGIVEAVKELTAAQA